MSTQRIILAVDIAKKDDVTEYPTDEQVAAVMQDILADATKHDGELGWRIVTVEARM